MSACASRRTRSSARSAGCSRISAGSDKRVDNLATHFAAAEKDVRDIRTSTEKIVRRGDRIQDVDLEKPVPPLTLVPPATAGSKFS